MVQKMTGSDRQDRLAVLAESINETGRMARVNASLTLIGALYLALTLLSADDENLLRNAVVTLPQFETGISLERSYLFAPIVFLYLHVQTLFLLAVLARKVRTYEYSLSRVSGVDGLVKAEYRDWLSAINLVQGLQGTGTFAVGARVMTWIGTAGVPLLLLLLIDTSFLRYQSSWISALHHVCFSADLVCVWIFWRRVDSGYRQSRHEQMQELTAPLMAIKKWMAILCSIALIAILWIFGWPERYHDGINDAMSDGHSQLRESKTLWTEVINFNLFDDVLCRNSPWRGFCRRLNVRGGTLLRSGIGGGPEGFVAEFNATKVDYYRRIYGLDLTNRSLRFADLGSTYLLAAQLSGADLRGATLNGATLHGAKLNGAKLHGTYLQWAELQDADLREAKLHGTHLQWAKLHGADLSRAELHGTHLQSAELHGADLRRAELHGAKLGWQKLGWQWTPFVQIGGAELVGAYLECSELHGADLTGTFVVGIEGKPITNKKTTLQDVAWTTDKLPQPEICSDGTIRCHLKLRNIRLDSTLAWNPDVTLTDHLLAYDIGNQSRPAWLQNSDAADNLSNECH